MMTTWYITPPRMTLPKQLFFFDGRRCCAIAVRGVVVRDRRTRPFFDGRPSHGRRQIPHTAPTAQLNKV